MHIAYGSWTRDDAPVDVIARIFKSPHTCLSIRAPNIFQKSGSQNTQNIPIKLIELNRDGSELWVFAYLQASFETLVASNNQQLCNGGYIQHSL